MNSDTHTALRVSFKKFVKYDLPGIIIATITMAVAWAVGHPLFAFIFFALHGYLNGVRLQLRVEELEAKLKETDK